MSFRVSSYAELILILQNLCLFFRYESTRGYYRDYLDSDVTPQKYSIIFIIKFILYSGYNWANLGIFFFFCNF